MALTPQQVAELRKKYGLDSMASTSSTSPQSQTQDRIKRLDEARLVATGQKIEQDPTTMSESQLADKRSADTYNPWFAASTQDKSVKGSLKEIGKAAVNVIPSALNAAKSAIGIISNPIESAKNLGKMAVGAAEKLIPGKQAQEDSFDSLVGALKERYDSLDNAQRTTVNDPFGAGADILSVISGGAALAGKARLLESAISATAKGAKKAAIAPAKMAVKPISKGAERVSDVITPIDEGVKRELIKTATSKTTGTKFDEYLSEAKKSVSDYSKPPALELAGNKAQEALKAMTKTAQDTGAKKGELTAKIGNRVDASEVVSTGLGKLRSYLNREGVSLRQEADGTIKFTRKAGREIKLTKSDLSVVKEFANKLAKLKDNGFQRVDDTVDYLQGLLYQKKAGAGKTLLPMDKRVVAGLKEVLSNMNRSLKNTATKGGYKEYAELNERYAKLANINKTLNKALGVEGNRGAALMKQLFSPSGTAPRKLFEAIKKETGIDLVEEATLAKFAMEISGDARQASMLEQLITGQMTTPKSFVAGAANKIIQKLQNPEAKARRIIEQAKKAK